MISLSVSRGDPSLFRPLSPFKVPVRIHLLQVVGVVGVDEQKKKFGATPYFFLHEHNGSDVEPAKC